jgi:hypothetical protein
MVTLEQILDKIAYAIILNINYYSEDPKLLLRENQKTVRNGLVKVGIQNENDRLFLYQTDVEAEGEDAANLTTIVDQINNFNAETEISSVTITVSCADTCPPTLPLIKIEEPNSGVNQFIENLIYDSATNNPLNIGQFISLSNEKSVIDTTKAGEYLDTTIYELLPTVRTRQQRIDDFFSEFINLAGEAPQYETDEFGDLSAPSDYKEGHDISAAQDTPEIGIEEENSFITRLDIHANTTNTGKTLQSLRDKINKYLEDVDQFLDTEPEDERPEYENKSDGYIKIRNLNQSIIIRKQEGDDVGLENFVQNTLHVDENHQCHTTGGPSYLCDGFSITTWVRFLDKTSRGTLLNYSNPLRTLDPKGFKLETYVLDKDTEMDSPTDFQDDDGLIKHTWGEVAEYYNLDVFTQSDSERFIRLVVRDNIDKDCNSPICETNGKLYDSHIGIEGLPREHYFVPEFGQEYDDRIDYVTGDELYLLTHTRVPIDFDEWFFVVASYNPAVNDDWEGIHSEYNSNSDYWRGNIKNPYTGNPNFPEYTHYSGYGAKCKVELISKSDLLRARGYKPE